jgi:hypothetical protein
VGGGKAEERGGWGKTIECGGAGGKTLECGDRRYSAAVSGIVGSGEVHQEGGGFQARGEGA